MPYYQKNNTRGKVPDSLIPDTCLLPSCTLQTSMAIPVEFSSQFIEVIGFHAFVTFTLSFKLFFLVFGAFGVQCLNAQYFISVMNLMMEQFLLLLVAFR